MLQSLISKPSQASHHKGNFYPQVAKTVQCGQRVGCVPGKYFLHGWTLTLYNHKWHTRRSVVHILAGKIDTPGLCLGHVWEGGLYNKLKGIEVHRRGSTRLNSCVISASLTSSIATASELTWPNLAESCNTKSRAQNDHHLVLETISTSYAENHECFTALDLLDTSSHNSHLRLRAGILQSSEYV